jgi:rare lipoprotein A (peptidoglycan hydrolase)
VVINDRGPFGGCLFDLSEEAFARLAVPFRGFPQAGIAP